MKHLLIILISILLLSSPVIGGKPIVVRKEKGILFRDTPFSKFVEGGKKWFKTGNEKTQVKYEGDILNGVPNGQGTITWSDGTKYVGEYKNGKRWNGIYYDQYGNIRGKTVNGKLK